MRYLAPFLLLLMLFACSANSSEPEWFLKPVHNPDFYSALVKVNKKNPDYRQEARDKALQDIAIQINSQIKSRIASAEWISGGLLGSQYRQSLELDSKASIRDLQLLQSHEDKREYYALYRLNKTQYQATRERDCERAKALAFETMQRFDAVEADFNQACSLIFSAMEALMDFLDLDLSHQSPAGKINLYSELFSRFNALPAALELSFRPQEEPLVARIMRSHYLYGNVSFKGKPGSNLPLLLKLEGDKGDFEPQLFTDNKGDFTLEIKRLHSSESPQRFSVQLNTQSFLERISQPALRELWQNLPFASASQLAMVKSPKLYLDYSFVAAYQNGLSGRIASQLATWELDTCSKLEDADYLLKVRIFAKAGDHLPNLNFYSSFGDIHLTLQDAKSGAQINYLEHLKLKSGGKSRKEAELQVETDAVNEILSGLLYRLLYDSFF